MREWLRRHPLAAFVPFQALIYFWNLGLLSPWGDEAYAFHAMHLPISEILRQLAHNVHPPLYYMLLYGWLRIPLGLSWEVQARALSGVFALGATFAADRWWARRLGERGRLCFLALWVTSPCLVLYARMCHSFCLQLLLGTVVAALVLEFSESRRWQTGLWLTAGLIATLYTHYVPGIALLAAANLWLAVKRRWRDAAVVDAVVGVAYLPWLWWLLRALGEWARQPPSYFFTGGALTEIPVKLAYWAMSFLMGEAQPDWATVAGAVLTVLVAWMAAVGARRNRPVAWLVAVLSVIGFIGVARWISYPFIPPRMLFVYAPMLALFVDGAMTHRRAGTAAVAGLLILAVTGIWSYSHGTGYRNQQYIMPLREIAAEIEGQSAPADSLVLVDTDNSDFATLRYCLEPGWAAIETQDPAAGRAVRAAIADPRVRTIWFLRSTHDVTPEQLDARFEQELRASLPARVEWFGRFSPLQEWVLRVLGMSQPPQYFQELLKFER